MSNPMLTPDGAWIIGTILGSFITAYPAYLAARRSGRKVETREHVEHEATRSAMTDTLHTVVGRLDEMHATIADMRDWQAEHATTHAIDSINSIGRPSLEFRKEN